MLKSIGKVATYCSLFLLFISFIACQQTEDTKNAFDNIKSIGDAIKKTAEEGKSTEDAEKEAMHYNDLKVFLPDIEGYEPKGESDGQITSAMGFSYSQITQNYQAEDNDRQNITVTIIDYNMAMSMYKMASAVLNTGLHIENDKEITKKADLGIDNVIAVEHFRKDQGDAMLTMGVGERFFVTISGTKQDNIDDLKAIATEEMPLQKMIDK